jgi:rubredoxin
MEKISFTLPDGAEISLYRDADGTWCCPVCGSAELQDQPYYAEGGASFEMCSVCGFEFGFDDEPFASGTPISGIQNNWIRWRQKLLEGARFNEAKYNMLAEQLKNIETPAE